MSGRAPRVAARRITFMIASMVSLLVVAAFRTPPPAAASEQPAPAMLLRCWHDNLSMWHCGDSTYSASGVRAADIVSVGLSVKTRDGRTVTMDLPGNTDAVFLTPASIRMFLARYYRDTDQRMKLRGVDSLLRQR